MYKLCDICIRSIHGIICNNTIDVRQLADYIIIWSIIFYRNASAGIVYLHFTLAH